MRRALILAAGVLALADPTLAAGPSSCGCAPTPVAGTGTGAAGGGQAAGGAASRSKSYSYGASWSGASSSSSTSTSVSVTTSGVASSSGAVNAQALVNAQSSGYGGGGGGWTEGGGGVVTTIEDIHIEPTAPPAKTCVDWRSEVRVARLEASCVDDKDVPHPASQVNPQREIPDGYEGEVYRCIAGARMRFTLIGAGGEGQTRTCQKGEALARTAAGQLECRPQKPARDCNERSLLRRYGAGDKLVRTAAGKVCAAWRDAAEPSGPQVLN